MSTSLEVISVALIDAPKVFIWPVPTQKAENKKNQVREKKEREKKEREKKEEARNIDRLKRRRFRAQDSRSTVVEIVAREQYQKRTKGKLSAFIIFQ